MVISALSIVGRPRHRRGTVLPLVALTIVAQLSFLALAIDLGMVAISKTQAQQAADLAALTAARSLNGSAASNYNQSAATTNAQNLLSYNRVLGQQIQASQLQLTYGSYDYSQTAQSFSANYPPLNGSPTTAVTATVTTGSSPAAFSKVFGTQLLPNLSATAQAVHRPRDIALVMDLSSSMRYGTLLGFDIQTSTRATNNPDTLVPTFGQYSSNTGLTGPTTNRTSIYDNYTISPSNTTTGNSSYNLTYINGFYQNAAYASPLIRAFDSFTSTDGGNTWTAPTSGPPPPQLPPSSYASVPGGDVPLFKSGSTTTYAQTVKDVVGSTSRNASWELDGYSNYTNGSLSNAAQGQSSYANAPFYGYTQGPGYYGKSFFIWPPDPRQPLTTANDATQIKQFLTDFGYTTNDFASTSVTTTLSAGINNSQTSLTVPPPSSPSGPFPSAPFRILVNNSEIMVVTSVAGTTTLTLTVQRGKDGTSAATSSLGKTVGLLTDRPLKGIFGVTTTTNSQNWPWPNDGGSSLRSYLTSNVYLPGNLIANRTLQTTDPVYQQIMRLYSWNYVIDNLGTTPCDWRLRFFSNTNDDNTNIFNTSNGQLLTPGTGNYTINYNEILRWITQSANPFPTQLRAGRVKYYGSIPTSITGTWPSYGSTDQRFWVEFIDHVLGFRQTSAGNYQDVSAYAGYGSDFTWGTNAITTLPGSGTQYMSYTDNPDRPLLRYWFSPILMVDYLHNYNMYSQLPNSYYVMQPGDTYEAPVYTGRQAYQASINTVQNNHPNDWFTLVFYSEPRTSSSSTTRFNNVACPMGTNYNYAKAALFFPYSTINADGSANNTEITPYDADPSTSSVPSANFVDTPRPKGNTCFAMGLMLSYNQFAVTPTTDSTLRSFVSSSPITFPSGMAGGMDARGPRRSSSSKPTAWRTQWQPPIL